jgi:hypothetical protein
MDYGDNFSSLMMTKCRLEEIVFGADFAIQSCHTMLELWKKKFEDTLES